MVGPSFVSPSRAPRLRFFVVADLGQSNDRSAVGVLQRTITDTVADPVSFSRGEMARFDLRHLERFPLGTSYPDVVARIAALIDDLSLRFPFVDLEMVFDHTGVGRAVGDLLRELPLWRSPSQVGCGWRRLVPVHIHHGESVTHKPHGGLGVPKRDLVASAVVLFQAHLLRVAERLPERDILIRELLSFRSRVSAAGSDSYGNDPKLSKNDDCVTVVALAAWAAQRDRGRGGYLPRSGALPGFPTGGGFTF